MTRRAYVPAGWRGPIADFLINQRAAGRSENTCYTRRQHLERVARAHADISPWSVTGEQLVAWLAQLDVATETRRGYRNTLRAFYAWGHESGRCAEDPSLALPKIRMAAPHPRPLPDPIYSDALRRADARERIMLRLGGEMGMRRGEVARAHTRDIEPDLDGYSLLVHGKGDKERLVPIPDDLARELLRLPTGYLFPGDDDGHLSPRWVGTIVSRLLPPGWTMHKLRHRAASRWYGLDRDTFVVQDLLGHASPVTTRAYVAVPRANMRRTVIEAA